MSGRRTEMDEVNAEDGALPVDSDLEAGETTAGRPRPVHLRWPYIALVAAGGAIGTVIRELLTLSIPSVGQLPVTTFGINVIGAFALGFLLDALVRRGPDEGGRRTLRLLLGTGMLGGFTTYSALATDTGILLVDGAVTLAVGYALGTLVLGAIATISGIAIASALHRHSAPGAPTGGAKE